MSVAGTWNITIDSPLGKQAATLTITEDGDAVSGTARAAGEDGPMQGLTRTGDSLTWQQKVAKPMPLDITFDVTVTGDAMSGTATAGMFGSFPVSGTRA